MSEKLVIDNFGHEWKKFNNFKENDLKLKKIFNDYFHIFPKNKFLNKKNVGADIGCGSGRWSIFIASKVKRLYCIDPSESLDVAKKNLKKFKNCVFLKQSVYNLRVRDQFFDFAYSLGVLHHIKDTEKGLKNCVKKLKKNSPFLLYLYYNFDNRSLFYYFLWYLSNLLRIIISRLPNNIKNVICDIIALLIYYPFSRISYILSLAGINTNNFPLNYYKDKKFYIMRNDSLDRFGTIIEKRFSRKEIKKMMISSGLKNIKFSEKAPYWCAVGFKK
jgi:ubiquinone/menaquinone biosynthesis C-methylase UbiE